MDALEQYISQHREELQQPAEAYPLPVAVWQNINSQLEEDQLAQALEEGSPKPSVPPRVWNNIEGQLHKQAEAEKPSSTHHTALKPEKMVPLRRMWQMAAVFVVILVATVFLQSYWQTPPSLQQPAKMAEAPSNTAQQTTARSDLLQAESYYMAVIQKKRASLEKYDLQKYGINPQDFKETLKQLDNDYMQLKSDFEQSQEHGQVLQTMIHNLQLRMDLLNRQLQLLDKLKQQHLSEEGLQINT